MMKNLNEPRRRDEEFEHGEIKDETATRSEAEVVPFQRRPDNEGMLLSKRQGEELRSRWGRIQTNFVDEPRQAVEDADNLVADAIKQIEEVFAAQRANLEKKWRQGDEVTTEDLRVSLQHYRAFFDHLLSLQNTAVE